MSARKKPIDQVVVMRVFAVVVGLVCLFIGREAISQGYLWNTGYNARVGAETTTSTLSWVIYGALLVAAGLIPWGWIFSRRNR